MSHGLKDLFLCIALVAFITWLLGVFGPQLDEKTAAQVQEANDLQRDLNDAAMCRQKFGEASFVHTADGTLVCIPRHGKRIIASNY